MTLLDNPEFARVATVLIQLVALVVIVATAFALTLALIRGGRDEAAKQEDPATTPSVVVRLPRPPVDDSVRGTKDFSRMRDVSPDNGGLGPLDHKKGLTSRKRES